jgi:hypothetical protein
MPEQTERTTPRCLILERHVWETGFGQEQLQIPLKPAEEFFGAGATSRPIRVRIAGASHEYPCAVSKKHAASGTRRINGLDLVGLLGSCFVFFQETTDLDLYDFWVQYDMPIVVARFPGWRQAKSSQYGRGRLVNIVSAPVERSIARMNG